jgi:parallel beta-helix repeat protein
MAVVKVIHGDGVTIPYEVYYGTSSTIIQEAIDYVNGEGGGEIQLSNGVWTIDQNVNNTGDESDPQNIQGCWGLMLYENITLRGEGPGTILENGLPDEQGYSPSLISIINTNGSPYEYSNIVIKDLTIRSTFPTYVYGVYASGVGKSYVGGGVIGAQGRYNATSVGVTKILKFGFVIENCYFDTYFQSIYCYDTSWCRISKNKFKNCSVAPINISMSCYSNIINHNLIQNCQSDGIMLNSACDNTIIGNVFQNNNGYNIGIYTNSNYNIISSNITKNGSSGICIGAGCSENTIIGNSASNNSVNGIYIAASTTYTTVCGNTTQNNNSAGIKLMTAKYANVFANSSQNNTSHGIALDGGDYNNIGSNSVTYNATYGIYANASNNLNICGNIAKGNTTASMTAAGGTNLTSAANCSM